MNIAKFLRIAFHRAPPVAASEDLLFQISNQKACFIV